VYFYFILLIGYFLLYFLASLFSRFPRSSSIILELVEPCTSQLFPWSLLWSPVNGRPLCRLLELLKVRHTRSRSTHHVPTCFTFWNVPAYHEVNCLWLTVRFYEGGIPWASNFRGLRYFSCLLLLSPLEKFWLSMCLLGTNVYSEINIERWKYMFKPRRHNSGQNSNMPTRTAGNSVVTWQNSSKNIKIKFVINKIWRIIDSNQ
jgi:hypothetical protein